MSKVLERFIKYISIDTSSSEESGLHPSTDKQKKLGLVLKNELDFLGATNVYHDEHNYVYAIIPSTDSSIDKTIGLVAHMDTSPEASGEDVKAIFIKNYDGKDILISSTQKLSPSVFPELKNYIGKTIIHTDGLTLLGSDDKAGIAEIMTLAEILLSDIASGNSQYKHGAISIAFTPDEEIGEGVMFFDVKRFGADYAYTVDGGALGELEYENFNAASAVIEFSGISIHPGDAKDKMINAASIACEFQSMIPLDERPETTSGYEGFYHLTDMEGDVTSAKLTYIIRDHDNSQFIARKAFVEQCVNIINSKYGAGTAKAIIKDQYKNMREIIDPQNMFLIDKASEAMRINGVEPIIKPIRGGTDGANLSFMGIPCPNLSTGGHNFHGVYEYIPLESMEKMVEVLLSIVVS
ncbi:MAG: peptidase T [Saccharofermentans sp.]|nr:peptidase T [Saccharofermentans sp.]